jgi:adenine-specific DNA methylase
MNQELSATKLLVEEILPLSKINETARKEAAFKQIRFPKIGNLHPYLARRPPSTARVLTLASLLPSHVIKEEFEQALGFDRISSVPYKLLYLVNPDKAYVKELVKKYTGRDPENIVVVDPMAGGGSIPLEALRLGFRTVAMDYNPVAYIILKATLEYPAKYGAKLYEDVKKEVEALIEYARKELSQYYAEDAYNYIIARGYRCPACRGLVPIIHNNVILEDKKKGKYIYMKFDFNRQNKSFTVEITNTKEKFERLRCPYCGSPLNEEIALRDWVKRHKELLNIALSGDIEKAKEKIQELLETHIILVKETPEGFKPAGEKDGQTLVKAYLDLTAQIKELRKYLPDAQIPRENEVFTPTRETGIQYWYELFNPRQLLILLKLLKYVREHIETLVEEHGEYGVAVSLYLALGVSKFVNFNNITTTWDNSTATIRELVDHYSRSRSVDLGLEYCEAKRLDEALRWVFEPHVESIGRTAGGVLPVLRLLTQWLDGLGDRIYVLCGDARKLSSILSEIGINAVDVVNVDPPYLAQHFYSDLMEFFWQTNRIMLQPAIERGYLFNRGPERGRVELYIEGWSPLLPVLPREEEIIARKGRDKITDLSAGLEVADAMKHTGKWYVVKMWEFFSEVYKVLRKDGVLIVWFTHSDPAAWEAIVSSLYAAGFTLSKAWPVWTEMQARRVALLTSAFFTSLTLVLRRGDIAERVITGAKTVEEIMHGEDAKEAIKRGVQEALISARMSGASGPELFVMGLAGGIAGATRIWNPSIDEVREGFSKQKSLGEYMEDEVLRRRIKLKSAVEFFDKVLYPAAVYLSLEALLEDYMGEVVKLDERMKRDILTVDNYTKAYLLMWTATRYTGERELAYDFVEKVCKTLNTERQNLTYFGLIRQEESSRYKVLFGGEVYEAVGGRLERLTKTVAGHAIHVLRLIGEKPKDDVTKAAKAVFSTIPTSRNVSTTALFLLRTATEEELRLVNLSGISREFAESVLMKLYQGV